MTAIGWRRTSFLVAFLLLHASLAWAAWPTDPTVNLPICTAVHDQTYPTVASDGAGGAYFIWIDARVDGISTDVYMQHVDLTGAVKWAANGIALTSGGGAGVSPVIVPDGAGGSIVAWAWSTVASGNQIIAQRVNSAGALLWGPNGVVLSLAPTNASEYYPRIVSDGAGGAVVAWQYGVGSPSPSYDVYVQRVTEAGSIAPGWAVNGVLASTAAGDRVNPVLTSDGAAGAIVAWQTGFAISSNDIMAQHVDASGVRQWGAGGVTVAAEINAQYMPIIASDGAGGAIIAWQDTRLLGIYDVYAQRLNAAGTPQWTSGGIPLSPGTHAQILPQMVSDKAGGAIVAWHDGRNAATASDIYAQRVDGAGTLLWGGGAALCTSSGTQQYVQVISDGLHGAIVTWEDEAGANAPNVFAQHVGGAGTTNWGANGAAISTATIYQQTPMISTNGAGGAIITWQDSRLLAGWEVYAQNVNADGSLGGSLASVPGASPAVDLAIRSAGANPGSSGLSFALSLPDDSAAELDVFDLSGRLIDSQAVGALGAGTHVIAVHPRTASLSPGVYCVRLIQGARRVTTKAVLLR